VRIAAVSNWLPAAVPLAHPHSYCDIDAFAASVVPGPIATAISLAASTTPVTHAMRPTLACLQRRQGCGQEAQGHVRTFVPFASCSVVAAFRPCFRVVTAGRACRSHVLLAVAPLPFYRAPQRTPSALPPPFRAVAAVAATTAATRTRRVRLSAPPSPLVARGVATRQRGSRE
jgi:hypothetical protein